MPSAVPTVAARRPLGSQCLVTSSEWLAEQTVLYKRNKNVKYFLRLCVGVGGQGWCLNPSFLRLRGNHSEGAKHACFMPFCCYNRHWPMASSACTGAVHMALSFVPGCIAFSQILLYKSTQSSVLRNNDFDVLCYLQLTGLTGVVHTLHAAEMSCTGASKTAGWTSRECQTSVSTVLSEFFQFTQGVWKIPGHLGVCRYWHKSLLPYSTSQNELQGQPNSRGRWTLTLHRKPYLQGWEELWLSFYRLSSELIFYSLSAFKRENIKNICLAAKYDILIQSKWRSGGGTQEKYDAVFGIHK